MSEARHDGEASEKPRVSIWKRLLLGSGLFIVLLLGLGFAQHALQGSRDRGLLAETLAELDESDPGWRLEDLEEARPAPADDANSALVLRAAHRLVPKGVPNETVMERFDPKLLRLAQLLDAERAALLEKELLGAEAALTEARKMAGMPVGRHAIAHARSPLGTLLTHVQEVRDVTRLLQFDALRWGQRGDVDRALRSSGAACNAGRSFGDEPFILSQLVRIACLDMAGSSIERALALGEPSEEALAGLQALLEREEGHNTLLVALRGERAQLHQLLISLTDGSMPSRPFFDRDLFDLSWEQVVRRWEGTGAIRREHPLALKLMSRASDNARLPPHEQPAAEKELNDEVAKLPRRALITRSLLPATTKIAESCRRKLAQMRCLKVLLALERHRRRAGAWPGKLEELAPKLLSAVPLDPFDGKPLRYRIVADGLVVYSVGPDGSDDGGSVAPGPHGKAKDIGFRLWDVKQRRQQPKPPMPK
jgi:hypothetical protein